MKKILATILALVMVFSLSVSALAADKTENITINETSYGTVEVSIADGTETVYSVTVAWTDTTMEYYKNSGIWNPETHKYEPDENAEEHELSRWIDGYATVTVTNHSNAAVRATIEERENTTGTTYGFDQEWFDLETAVGTEVEEAPYNSFIISATSEPTSEDRDTFAVTISMPASAEPEPETIALSFKDDSSLAGKDSTVTVLLPDGYTYENTTYELDLGDDQLGADCNVSVAPGENLNELTVSHGGTVCGGGGGKVATLIVTSTADPSIKGTIVIEAYC